MFEEYLKDKFIEANPEYLNEEVFEEKFVDWMNNLDPLQWLCFGEEFGVHVLNTLDK